MIFSLVILIVFHNGLGLDVGEPYRTQLTLSEETVLKSSRTFSKEYQLKKELELYRKVLFQGNGSKKRKHCYEQQKIPESRFKCFFFEQDVLAPIREPNCAGSGTQVVSEVKLYLDTMRKTYGLYPTEHIGWYMIHFT